MATYQDIINQAAAKGISSDKVAATAKALGINVGNTGQMSWSTPEAQKTAYKEVYNKDMPVSKPIDYDWKDFSSNMGAATGDKKATPVNNKIQPISTLTKFEGESDDDFAWRQKFSDLSGSLNQLNVGDSEFKATLDKNMKAALLKNQQLQQELDSYKNKVDSDFELVRNKFDENTKAQLARIDELEKTYMDNLNNMRGLQGQYYNTQNEALNARVGGEQAGLQGTLSSRGIDQSVINDAMSKARTKHLDQFNSLQKNNIDVLNQLNDAYNTFAQQINTQRGGLEANDLALVKEKFDLHKAMQDTGTQYNQSMINTSFKPYEDAINEISSAQQKEMGYQAQDQAIASRFASGTSADKMQLLQNKLAIITQDSAGNSKLTDIDIAMLQRAASLKSYPEALQYLINAGKYVASTSSGSTSSIAQAAKTGSLEKVVANVPTTSTSTTPTSGDVASTINAIKDIGTIQGLNNLVKNYNIDTTSSTPANKGTSIADQYIAATTPKYGNTILTTPTTQAELNTNYYKYAGIAKNLKTQIDNLERNNKGYTIGGSVDKKIKDLTKQYNDTVSLIEKIDTARKSFSGTTATNKVNQFIKDNTNI